MRKLLLCALCLLVSLPGAAQNTSDAEAAMMKYAAVTKTYNTAAMAGFMHPEALKRLRATITTALQGPKSDLAKAQLLPMFSVSTIAGFSSLSDAEIYKRLNDTVAKGAPELIEMMAKSSYEIVGSFVKDGTAYVTYNLKLSVQGQAVSTQAVQTMKVHNGQWLLMLPSTADATIASIEARFK